MRDNGTDRDIALSLLQSLTAIKEGVAQINANLFSVIIITQPTDIEAAVDETVTFTVSAANVVAYQWQYANKNSPDNWSNSANTGYNTNSLSVVVSTPRYSYWFRCAMTGKDGQVVYSDRVCMLAPAGG